MFPRLNFPLEKYNVKLCIEMEIFICAREAWEGIFNDVERFSLRANLLCISGYDKKGFIEGRETIPH